jgi:hypothetical protein
MNPSLLLAILKDIVVPEVTSFIYDHYHKTGELPTQEDLEKLIDSKAGSIVMKGESFLKQFE